MIQTIKDYAYRVLINYIPLEGFAASFAYQATPYGFDPKTDPIGYGATPDEAVENLLSQMEPHK